ncbi:MAG: RDD family protein [Anaerolineae bacterium]
MLTFLIRCFAQLFDYAVFYLIAGFVFSFFPAYFDESFQLYFVLSIPFIWIFFETLFIRCLSTTLGKFLFGFSVRHADGSRLSFVSALKFACWGGGKKEGKDRIVYSCKKGFWRKAFGVLGALSILLGAYQGLALKDAVISFKKQETAQGWIHYASSEGGFSVDFPTEPEQELKYLEIAMANRTLSYNEYRSSQEDPHISYAVSHIQLPRRFGFAPSNTLLKGALQVIVESEPGAILVSKQFSKFRGLPALDFLYKQGSQEEICGRLILVKNKLFKLTVVYPSSYASELKSVEFLESFDLTPKKMG